MKKYILAKFNLFLLLAIILSSTELYSGYDDEPDVRDMSFKERIFVGGYIGLQFGDYTFIDISPLAGFRVTNRLSAGTGITYQYFHYRLAGKGTHTYGFSGFARFLIIPQAFVHAEYEMLNVETIGFDQDYDERVWEQNYLLGAGYRLRLGEKVYFNLMLLYNFNDDSRVYQQNPIFRFSFEVGL